MDDDLMSLRGGSSPFGGDSIPDENPLGLGLDDFVPAPPEPPASEPPAMSAAAAAPAAKPIPEPKAKPADKPKPAPKPKSAPASGGGGGFLGMTPQQSMLLSIFLFLDVAILGCLILIAVGAIKL